MARLPYVDPATAPPKVREVLERLPVQLNIFRMMAHAETNFRPLLRLGASILGEQKLDARLRELAILRVAKLSPARYEWVQHVPIAKAVGATDDAGCGDRARRDRRPNASMRDDSTRAALHRRGGARRERVGRNVRRR